MVNNITTRRVKGEPLSNDEIDDNFDNLSEAIDKTSDEFQEIVSNLFLPQPSNIDFTSEVDYFYFGWQFEGSWRVNRQTKENGNTLKSTNEINTEYVNLDDAWTNRNTLNYQ